MNAAVAVCDGWADRSSSCPYTDDNGDAAWRFPGGGDYFGLDAGADGAFHLVWPDSRDGVYRLRHARVEVAR